MLTFNELPIYDIAVDDEFADAMLDFISLVSEPAIMMKGIAFNQNTELTRYKFQKDKQIVVGPAMIPDLPIFRRDPELGEYYVRFQADRIEKLAHRFNKAPKEFKVNVDHSTVVKSAYVIENWIVEDKEFDKSKKYGFDVPVGTWMVAIKIEDEQFWNDEIIENEKFGFSVEGAFGLEIINMSIEKQIKAELSKIKEEEFESYTDYPQAAVENAKIALRWADENGWGNCGTPVGKARANQLANQEPISEETIARMASFARHRENSDKELGDGCGRLVWLAWGGTEGIEWASRKLDAIRNNNNNNNQELNTQEMNKSKLKFAQAMLADGTSVWVSALEVGGEVYLFDVETLEKTPAPDADHVLEDGTTVTTVDGIITAIVPAPEQEVEVEIEAAVDPAIDTDAVLAIVQPKIDELYAVIAELKAMIEGKGIEPTTSNDVAEQAMSKAQLAMSVIKRLK
jgi:hypothetical protein